MAGEVRREWIDALLGEAGLPAAREILPLAGGANNRVYRVDHGRGSVLLKAYFFHPDDQRDRLNAEFAFSRFAWDRGLRCLPQPLACDRTKRLGLYEFIEGRALESHELTEHHREQAIAFYRGLNRHKDDADAQALPPASEACLSLRQHLACVNGRLERLERLPAASPEDAEASRLVRSELVPAWRQVRDHVLCEASELGIELDRPIDREDMRLSPSDFGFHNVIVAMDGRLRFFDFEYAGWDDPAKMVCDFLCQPAVPVPAAWHAEFAREVVCDLSHPAWHLRRINLLLEVYRIKWCCILLNEFLPVGRQRRQFAQHADPEAARKQRQLEKVRRALQAMRDSSRRSVPQD